jgi:hypothetical protein
VMISVGHRLGLSWPPWRLRRARRSPSGQALPSATCASGSR